MDDMLKKIIEELKNEMIEKQNSKIQVAVTDDDDREKHYDFIRFKEAIDEEIEAYVDYQSKMIQRKINEKFINEKKEVMKKKSEFWNYVYKKYNLDETKEYTFDVRKGIVYLVGEKESEVKKPIIN